MSSQTRNEPDEGYFNDISRQPNRRKNESPGSAHENNDPQNDAVDGGLPRTKRIACIICRKRKLKCDGNKPSCGTCARLKHSCAYDEVRRKSGPKRGYVKELETRLAQVESLLKTTGSRNGTSGGTLHADAAFVQSPVDQVSQPDYMNMDLGVDCGDDMERAMNAAGLFQGHTTQEAIPNVMGDNSEDIGGLGNTFSWEMIGLGLDEPLPSQDVIDDLHQIYFEKLHAAVPVMHKYRYLAAMNLSPSMRPPVCLRYAMWCLAAGATDRYSDLHTHFYQRARKYVEIDEMRGHGEGCLSVAHTQAWALISFYEYKMMYFPRAWMSTGRSVRMAQMMGLHRMDGGQSDCKQVLPPPRDWIEREERRRTFWTVYCGDRYASICTGWPMTIDNKDILSNLPATEDAFERNTPQETLSLEETLSSEGDSFLSPFGGVIVMANLLGRNLIHVNQPGPDDRPFDLSGEFWKRHREMDNVLSKVSLSLPDHLRLPAGIRDPNIVFLNMEIHTSTICLHQAAISTATAHGVQDSTITESRSRCLVAATEISNIMRLISHIDITSNHPFMVYCVYVAARVLVQHQRTRPDDQASQSSLQFLVSVMRALKRKHPLAQSFLAQLDCDIQSGDIRTSSTQSEFSLNPCRFAEIVGGGKCPMPYDGDVRKPANQASDDLPRGHFHVMAQSMGGNGQESRQPTVSSINLATREQRTPQQRNPFRQTSQTQIQQCEWAVEIPHEPSDGPLLQRFETGMSSDQQTINSNQPTPNTSHHSSSNTSYSSPHLADDANPNCNLNGSADSHPAFFGGDSSFAGFTPPEDHSQYSLPGPAKADAGVGGYEPWRSNPVVGTPSAGTGLSPLGEGEWTQIMEGMGWDGGVLGQGLRQRNDG
ncbi:MAG: Fungal specific transcription factor [Lasallia pustulata]|uniref:Fungal specific transcription factor n=1 Tax=Lasallia pustulata TaxID=136370 RepID=A0A5M8PDH5_9LECA|nr:MAG: Fungal specific transcription factor [Lasallia pustulata]